MQSSKSRMGAFLAVVQIGLERGAAVSEVGEDAEGGESALMLRS